MPHWISKFRIRAILAMVAVLLASSSLADEAGPTPDRSAFFRIEFDSLESRTAHVDGEITVLGGTIKMLSWGHPWLPEGWATFVDQLEVRTADGTYIQAEPVTEDGWGSWTVDVEDETRVTISYDIRFDHDQYNWNLAGGADSRPAYSNGGLYLVTRALFIYSPYGIDEADVQFITPEDWVISTPWARSDRAPNTFHVDRWGSLLNNAVVLGEHIQNQIQIGDTMVILAVDPALEAYIDDFEDTFRTQLESYGNLFGGTPDIGYLVALREADEIEGEAFNNSFNQIFVVEDLDERRRIWANVLGHELFHLWNGGGHALVGADKPRVEWFTEGFTEYYASLISFRSGILSEAEYFNKIARYFARYHISKNMWPADPISLIEAGEDKSGNWLYLYGGGATIALILDIEIRDLTNCERGLNDVMHLLNERFGQTHTPFEVADVLDAVNEVSGSDFGSFFSDYIEGAEAMPDFAFHLRKAGLAVDDYGDEYYVRRIQNPTRAQAMVYDSLFEQDW